jgi:hypothetical protein
MVEVPENASILQKRIAERLNTLGTNPRAASVAAGLGPDAVRTILDGRSRQPRADRLAAIASVLACDVRYLLGTVSEPWSTESQAAAQLIKERAKIAREPHPSRVLRLRQSVAVGVWRRSGDYVERPSAEVLLVNLKKAGADADQWLERMTDTSMEVIIPKGSLVHVVSADNCEDHVWRSGRCVVVERWDGEFVERSIRQIIDGDPGEMILASRPGQRGSPESFTEQPDTSQPRHTRIVALCLAVFTQLVENYFGPFYPEDL